MIRTSARSLLLGQRGRVERLDRDIDLPELGLELLCCRVARVRCALEESRQVIAALDALRDKLADDDRSAVEKAQSLLEEFKSIITTLDGQLAAMRWLAQKQFRPKSEKVAPGQLAMDRGDHLDSAAGVRARR